MYLLPKVEIRAVTRHIFSDFRRVLFRVVYHQSSRVTIERIRRVGISQQLRQEHLRTHHQKKMKAGES